MRPLSHVLAGATLFISATLGAQSSAPAPSLTYAFSARIMVAPPIETGDVDGARKRFIAITGGTVYGPRLQGEVLAGGGDWQTILPGGLTDLDTRYSLKTKDGTVIAIRNPGVRTATPDVIERLAKGEAVDPSLYYFRTTPRFEVKAGPYDWLRRKMFVARGIRKPDHVIIDFYEVN
jgi:Protein of unknown function (DUF3237)